jgi:hypothetical protein
MVTEGLGGVHLTSFFALSSVNLLSCSNISITSELEAPCNAVEPSYLNVQNSKHKILLYHGMVYTSTVITLQ